MREIAPMPPCVRISGLKVNRDRVVNACLDALICQLLLPSCPLRSCGSHRHDRHGGWRRLLGCFNPAAGKGLVVIAGRGSTGVRPLLDITQLHTQDSALDTFHAEVIALEHVMIFLFCAPIPQHPVYSEQSGCCGIGARNRNIITCSRAITSAWKVSRAPCACEDALYREVDGRPSSRGPLLRPGLCRQRD